MSYKIDDNIKFIKDKPEELENYYKDLTEILDKQGNIRFQGNTVVKSFKDLIIKFFYEKYETRFLDGQLHCYDSKRRSFIDFYLLQKHYLQEPISFKDCVVIYFELIRCPESYIKQNPTMKKYWADYYDYYYCTGVRRNVFVLATTPTKEEFEFLDKYNFKIKENEIQTEKELS